MSSKNKTIFSISMVKNEADIIESFVRYNMSVLDGMIILDNNSDDNTLKILNALKDEGINIHLFESEKKGYFQYSILNMLLLKAVEEFKVDIIVPLDSDEFIISNTGGNPREIIEKIDPDTYLLVKWKTFVPDFSKNQNQKFIPAKITAARDESYESYYKVIVPKEIVENYNAKLSKGNHTITYNKKYHKNIKQYISPDLRIAHFPLRTKDQTIRKVVTGWINTINRIDKKDNESFHWKQIFDRIKEGNISENDVVNCVKDYAVTNSQSEVSTYEDPVDLSFCEDVEIIYQQKSVKPFSTILETFEFISLENTANRKQLTMEINQLNNTVKRLSSELEQTKKQEKILNSKMLIYEQSKSWKITSPIRKIGTIMRNLLNYKKN
jgi:hypothetical protein